VGGCQQQEKVEWDEEVTQDFLKYLLLKLLPCLKQLHNEQREELKVEQNLQRAFSLHHYLSYAPLLVSEKNMLPLPVC
jgi:hypothetical protein